MGVHEDEYFQTGQRFIPELRARRPEPQVFVHAADAAACGIGDGQWVERAP